MNKAKSKNSKTRKKRPSLKKHIILTEWRMRGHVEVYGYDREDAENKIKMEDVGVPVFLWELCDGVIEGGKVKNNI